MIRILFDIFIILHGLIHLLYLGQSSRLFELQPGMVWPDRSWAFSRFFTEKTTEKIANACLILTALLFFVGGTCQLIGKDWWRLVVSLAAIISTILFILFWDGSLKKLADQGWVGILINLAILAVVHLIRWP